MNPLVILAQHQRVHRHPNTLAKTPRAACTFRLLNPARLEVVELQPEQFFPTGELNCDYVFQVAALPQEIYVELKGSAFLHALDQLAHTMARLRSSKPEPEKHCFVVIAKSPAMDIRNQKLLLTFAQRHKCQIKIKTLHAEYTLPSR